MKICKTCVMDETDPNLSLDRSGECFQCRNYKDSVVPILCGQCDDPFKEVAEKIKNEQKGSEFECLVGLSGGLDSSFMLYKAVKEYGLRPKVLHVDAGWNTEQATSNIENIVRYLDLELNTIVINWDEMRKLQVAFMNAGVPHLDVPQDHAFLATVYNFAAENKLKYILNGGNYATEGIRNPLSWLYYGSDTLQLRDVYKHSYTTPLTAYPISSALMHRIFYRYYKRISNLKPLNFMRFRKYEAEQELRLAYGYRSYRQKHFESHFTKFFEGYLLPSRFGYDTRKPQFSSLIWSGDMTREEALNKLKTPSLTREEIEFYFDYIPAKLKMTKFEFNQVLSMPLRTYRDYKNIDSIYRIGAEALNLLGLEKTIKR